MGDEGWTKSYRSKWTHPVFRSLLHAGVWSWMIDSAAWRDTSTRFCDHVISLKRGQLVSSERFMAEGFEVTRKVIRNLLDALERAQMISREKAQGVTIITICNYDKYQSMEDQGGPVEEHEEGPGRAQAGPRPGPNKKEDNNLRKKESKNHPEDAEFSDWYDAYPRRVDPGRAAKAYRAARKLASAADLLAGARRYAAECNGKETRFIKHPASWLNARSWENEPELRVVATNDLGLPVREQPYDALEDYRKNIGRVII